MECDQLFSCKCYCSRSTDVNPQLYTFFHIHEGQVLYIYYRLFKWEILFVEAFRKTFKWNIDSVSWLEVTKLKCSFPHPDHFFNVKVRARHLNARSQQSRSVSSMLIFLKVVIELEKCLVEILDWTIKSSMNFSTVKLDLHE